MSRVTHAANVPEITDEPPERMSFSDHPNVKGVAGAVQRIYELFGVTVTEHYIRRAVSRHRLVRHEICHQIHFSDRALYDFIVIGTRKNSKVGA